MGNCGEGRGQRSENHGRMAEAVSNRFEPHPRHHFSLGVAMSEAISPDQIAEAKEEYLPPVVLYAFNETIAKHWNNNRSKFTQDEIIEVIMAKMLIKRSDVFSRKYLDVEDVFRAKGWKVKYDKPGYNESYSASFEFSKK